MGKTIAILFVTLIGLGLIDMAPAKDVTNEYLLSQVKSIIHSFIQIDNKLERHEYRERLLGEIVKKALQSLQNGQKSMDPMKGILSRLDERVSQIETLLMSQEQKYTVQTEKIDELIKLTKLVAENNNKTVVPSKDPVVVEKPANKELLNEVRGLSATVWKVVAMANTLMMKAESMEERTPKTEELISKMESRLVSLYVPPSTTTPAAITIDNSEFENKVMESFKDIAGNINELKTFVPAQNQVSSGLLQDDKDFIQGLTNETLRALENLRGDALSATDKALATTTSRIQEVASNSDTNVSKLSENLSATTEILEKFYKDMNASYNNLNEGLANFNLVMLSNSDEILKTQRKVEFGTHQIQQKMADIVESQQAELSQALMKRFDDVDESLGSNHVEGVQNISATIESEISHVWRQIEVIYSEMRESKDAMNKLTGQTEVYVNGTFTTMDGMEAKVSQITSRMLEVDENLNYLLGRLSLITQEFNQIKTGLGDALEQIRGSFHEIREKVVNPGPGPHNIPRNEYETDFNLLSKRNAES